MHACMLRRDRSVSRLTLIAELRAKVAERDRQTDDIDSHQHGLHGSRSIGRCMPRGVALRLDGNGRAIAIDLT